MPTATLTFTLPDEAQDFYDASNGTSWHLVCWDLNESLRRRIKYGGEEYSSDYLKAVEDVRDELLRAIQERGLILDMP